MLTFLFFCCLAAECAFTFHQSDYEIIHHRLELINYNQQYVHNVNASLIPFNRTTRAINASFDLVRELHNSVGMIFRIFRHTLNDYSILAFDLNTDYCKMRNENTFGINDMAHYSNIPPCPLKKDHYYIKKYRPDESKFPPHVFPGEYKFEIKFKYSSVVLGELHWYGTFRQIEKLWK